MGQQSRIESGLGALLMIDPMELEKQLLDSGFKRATTVLPSGPKAWATVWFLSPCCLTQIAVRYGRDEDDTVENTMGHWRLQEYLVNRALEHCA